MNRIFKNLLLLLIFIICFYLESFAQVAQVVPDYFTTYTSDGFFSISYPENWEMPLYMIKGIKQRTDNMIKSMFEGASPEKNEVLFVAGDTLGGKNYNPNVSVMVTPVKHLELNSIAVEDFVGISKQMITEILKGKIISQATEIIDGEKSILLEFEVPTSPNSDLTLHTLQTFAIVEGFLWQVISVVIPPLKFVDYKADIYTIARSLKILLDPSKY